MSDDALHVTGGIFAALMVFGGGLMGGQTSDTGALVGLITGLGCWFLVMIGLVVIQRALKLRKQAKVIDEEVAATEEKEEDLAPTHTRL